MRLRSLLLLGFALACAPAPIGDPGRRYVSDPDYRRQVLEQSLVNPANGYSQRRLTNYRDDRWGRLPEWNPPVRLNGSEPRPLADGGSWSRDALIDLGRRAFFAYPAQINDALEVSSFGLWTDPDGQQAPFVLAQMPDGLEHPAMTCATCHAFPIEGHLVVGLPNATFHVPDTSARRGTVDVTLDDVDNPTAIADLRPVRFQQHLHHDATVRNGLIPLAIRIETLIITSSGATVRPPRRVALGLATYLWSLEVKSSGPRDAHSERGAGIFAATCAPCHSDAGLAGPPVPLDSVGTDTSVGLSPERTTGAYRVPSLLGVGLRQPLLANGAVATLSELLSPERSAPGHRFTDALQPEERADLQAFLESLASSDTDVSPPG